MGRTYFGTDGVRGTVGDHPMTVDFALHLASAAARVLAPDGGAVLIGKDTRLSGYMFETAIASGICAMGGHVMLTVRCAMAGVGIGPQSSTRPPTAQTPLAMACSSM